MGKETKSEEDKIFAPLKWKGSSVIWVGSFLANILTLLSVKTWIDLVLQKYKKESLLVAEVWVIVLLIIEGIVLFYGEKASVLIWIVAVYVLLDVLGATLRDIVINPQRHKDEKGEYILVRSRLRWMLMVPMNVMQVVLGFALLFLFYGDQFIPQIKEPMIALYQSALTFTTLGYGDIRPECTRGRVVVCLELAFFLIFLGMKLPVAISVLRVKERGEKYNSDSHHRKSA